jgi:hypothetical protein
MSKFSDLLDRLHSSFHSHNKHVAIDGPIIVESDFNQTPSLGVEFNLRCKIESKVILPENSPPEYYTMAFCDAKRNITEHVFGEFRSILREINQASYERDFIKVRNLVAELEQQMFKV